MPGRRGLVRDLTGSIVDRSEIARGPLSCMFPHVGSDQSKTEEDDRAARESARNRWVKSTLDYYVEACAIWQTAPRASLMTLRHVLEGWAHATAVARKPGFVPYKGGKLHEAPLGDIFTFAQKELPRDLQVWVRQAKQLSDPAHHNPGEHEPATPRLVQSALISCAALVEWTYRDIGGSAPPPLLDRTVRTLRSATVEEPVRVIATAFRTPTRRRSNGSRKEISRS